METAGIIKVLELLKKPLCENARLRVNYKPDLRHTNIERRASKRMNSLAIFDTNNFKAFNKKLVPSNEIQRATIVNTRLGGTFTVHDKKISKKVSA